MLSEKHGTIIKRLALLSAFCIALEIARILFSNSFNYFFLPFNLILAWVPLLFVLMAVKGNEGGVTIACLLAWLLFFPNAPYIVTDLIHLRYRAPVPLWYDALLIFATAFTGLTAGMYSVLLVYNKLKELLSKRKAKAVIMAAMILSGYGIYMGRFLRWNSWDVFLSPCSIMADTYNQMYCARTYGVTLITGLMLYLTFLVFEELTQTGKE